ncbi:hypothetical protein [Sphingomonas morindae]|uniref:Uncharacterized protein n=1 Tax=Sphingomonas morindae TaxID=1541170 RepID=A0ABY4XA75_9SPHN|nr:hypothetical protein [Sphingomonas morindae]USI73770.1 hypothetical protein LHA26_04690 [Sphingomonas morindae]
MDGDIGHGETEAPDRPEAIGAHGKPEEAQQHHQIYCDYRWSKETHIRKAKPENHS